MTVALSAFPQFSDAEGNPLSGGLVYSYAAGTTTPLATYTDRGGATPNANPVVLDSSGRASVWLTLNVPYKLILKSATGVTISTVDDYYGGADPLQLQAAGIVPATGGTYSGPVDFTGGATFSGTAAQDLATLDSLGIAAVQNANLWINSDFQVDQRGLTSIPDGSYGFDRAILISETGSVGISRLAQPVDGVPYALRITQPDATAKRVGCTQIAEARNCVAYRAKNMVFAAKVRCSAATTVRMALVAWTGAQDAPPRDVVNNWTSTNYTAGNFFIANTTTIAVGATTVSAGAWSDMTVSSASAGGIVAPSAMNNLYMVVWVDSTLAQNATLDMSCMRAGQGTLPPLWTPPDTQVEFARCMRYFEGYPVGSLDFIGNNFQAGQNNSYTIPLKVMKRASPTFASPWTGVNAGAITLSSSTPMSVIINVPNLVAGQWRITNSALASIEAELGV